MTCFKPLQAVRTDFTENPIRVLGPVTFFNQKLNMPGLLQLPCGSCVGCRLTYSKGWAVRNCHEAQVHDMDDLPSTFVTFTYNDYFNDRNGGALVYRDFQLMLKRLRKAHSERSYDYGFTSDPARPMRFYMCGEYGSRTFRPHFHALFYNLGFSDETLYKVNNGFRLYNSPAMSSLWVDVKSGESLGHVVTGSVTVQSAGYVARYCVKKALQGKSVHLLNHDTGEFLPDEFTQMSRKPGIAYEWFKRYSKGVYLDDKVVMANGIIYKPPRYYDNLLEKSDPELFENIKKARVEYALSPEAKSNNSIERLIVREQIQLSKLKHLPRML